MKKEAYFICNNCGHKFVKWQGKCSECGSWDSLEQVIEQPTPQNSNLPPVELVNLSNIATEKVRRIKSGFKEFDRVLGDGIVEGSANLLAGEPGVGKSTLILQIALNLAKENKKVLYICAEESPQQVYSRFNRFNISNPAVANNIFLAQAFHLESILELFKENAPDCLIIDSIQMISSLKFPSGPGSVVQIKECASVLISHIKKTRTILFLIGHVTKDGLIAGPKILEHLVDTVLYFESQSNYSYRILRATKNRYGSVPESAVFDIKANGIVEIQNPSVLFMREFKENVAGSAKFPMILGTRPVITEIQALLNKSVYPSPIRRAKGININRLQILLAILEKKLAISFSNVDVYLNVVGGWEIDDPACDLPIAIAIYSIAKNRLIPYNSVFFGEIDLLGFVRPVSMAHLRVSEALRQECSIIYLASSNYDELPEEIKKDKNISIVKVMHIKQLIKMIE